MDVIDQRLVPIRDFLDSLLGKKCWSVTAGAGTGSMVSMAFGRKIRRERPIKNPKLSPLQREFNGEFKIFIQHAAWEVKCRNNILCTNDDSNEDGGSMVTGLQRLVGKSVIATGLLGSSGDFEVFFEDDLFLRVMHLRVYYDADSYSFFSARRTITLSEEGVVEVTEAK